MKSGQEAMSSVAIQCQIEADSPPSPLWQGVKKYYPTSWPVNFPLKFLMTAVTSMLLSAAVTGAFDVQMQKNDVLVYNIIYCTWLICFLPGILLHTRLVYLIGKMSWLFFRLFAADLAVCLYLYYKGEEDILKRSISLRPLLAPGVQWMAEFVHFARFVLIVGCLSSSVVAHLFERPEVIIVNVEEAQEELQ